MRNRWFMCVGAICIAAMATGVRADIPTAKGACCGAGGACVETEQSECEDSGGAWEGAGTLCSETDCVGACCFIGAGTCTSLTQFRCRTAGGDWQGAGVPCAGACGALSGACCRINGECVDVDESTCRIIYSGDFGGYGTACGEEDCYDDKQPERAACCLPTGACVVTDEDGCDDLAGLYDSGADTCADADCIGACCFVNTGNCVPMTQMRCRQGGGVWQGEGTICGNGCDQDSVGACCLVQTVQGCSPRSTKEAPCCVVDEETCEKDLGGQYQGNGTTCSPNPCDFCPCDLNLDGNVGFSDVLRVVADWGVCDAELPCVSDVVADNNVGFNDLLEVLAHWGPCDS